MDKLYIPNDILREILFQLWLPRRHVELCLVSKRIKTILHSKAYIERLLKKYPQLRFLRSVPLLRATAEYNLLDISALRTLATSMLGYKHGVFPASTIHHVFATIWYSEGNPMAIPHSEADIFDSTSEKLARYIAALDRKCPDCLCPAPTSDDAVGHLLYYNELVLAVNLDFTCFGVITDKRISQRCMWWIAVIILLHNLGQGLTISTHLIVLYSSLGLNIENVTYLSGVEGLATRILSSTMKKGLHTEDCRAFYYPDRIGNSIVTLRPDPTWILGRKKVRIWSDAYSEVITPLEMWRKCRENNNEVIIFWLSSESLREVVKHVYNRNPDQDTILLLIRHLRSAIGLSEGKYQSVEFVNMLLKLLKWVEPERAEVAWSFDTFLEIKYSEAEIYAEEYVRIWDLERVNKSMGLARYDRVMSEHVKSLEQLRMVLNNSKMDERACLNVLRSSVWSLLDQEETYEILQIVVDYVMSNNKAKEDATIKVCLTERYRDVQRRFGVQLDMSVTLHTGTLSLYST